MQNYLVEHDNHSLKDQKKELQKMLLDKDNEIAHLKSHSQSLEDKIRNSKNVKESPYRRNNDLEEEIKCLNKIIKEKENEIRHIQTKVRRLQAENCHLQQNIIELQKKGDNNKKTHRSDITAVKSML